MRVTRLKTALMPLWLALVSYLAALTLLAVGDISMWVAMAFRVWVLVVSTLILLRAHHMDESDPPRRPGEHHD